VETPASSAATGRNCVAMSHPICDWNQRLAVSRHRTAPILDPPPRRHLRWSTAGGGASGWCRGLTCGCRRNGGHRRQRDAETSPAEQRVQNLRPKFSQISTHHFTWPPSLSFVWRLIIAILIIPFFFRIRWWFRSRLIDIFI
jgi:hypothetical protein